MPIEGIDLVESLSRAEPVGMSRRVYVGIIRDLEAHKMVPGQRLAETDLARRYEVGRNAVREAIQHLAARGIVDLSANRSPSIRQLTLEECFGVLDVAAALTTLLAEKAALNYKEAEHGEELTAATFALVTAAERDEHGAFNAARRQFYRILLTISRNGELQRLYPAVGMQIVHAQYASERLRQIRLIDYQMIANAVAQKDEQAAKAVAIRHIENVRALIADADR